MAWNLYTELRSAQILKQFYPKHLKEHSEWSVSNINVVSAIAIIRKKSTFYFLSNEVCWK